MRANKILSNSSSLRERRTEEERLSLFSDTYKIRGSGSTKQGGNDAILPALRRSENIWWETRKSHHGEK